MIKKESLILNFLSWGLMIAKWLFGIMVFLLVTIGIGLAVPGIRKNLSYSTNILGISTSNLTVVFGAIFVSLFIFMIFFAIISYLQKLIKNIKNSSFFEITNLISIKKILHLIWVLIIVQIFYGMLEIVLGILNNQAISINFAALLISFIFVVVVQTIYILLDNGLKLKKENDSFL